MTSKEYLAMVLGVSRETFLDAETERDDSYLYFVPPLCREIVTAPDPNNYGREIVLEERLPSYSGPVQFVPLGKKACPYCGNTSGLKDSRGMCVSCGGNLNG